MRFNDIDIQQDEDGIFDIILEEEKQDLQPYYGMRVALAVTLFTDRRAWPDEVADPRKRRGWHGDLFNRVVGDRIGSGLWLYEQSRVQEARGRHQGHILAELRLEVINSCSWILQEQLGIHVDAELKPEHSLRTVKINISIADKAGGSTSESFGLWDNTRSEALARL